MRVSIIGRLGKDPETSYTPEGVLTCRFSLAEDAGKDRSGERKTDWWDIICYRGTAEIVAKYGMRGTQVAVFGVARRREYQDRSGVTHRDLSVTASEVQLLSRPADSHGTQQAAGIVRDAAAAQQVGDDLPF